MFVHRLGLEFCTKWCVQDVWSVLLVLQKGVCLIFSHQQKFVCDEVALEMIVLNPVSCLFSVCDIPSDPPSLCFVTEVEVWLFCVSVTWMNNDSLGFFVCFFLLKWQAFPSVQGMTVQHESAQDIYLFRVTRCFASETRDQEVLPLGVSAVQWPFLFIFALRSKSLHFYFNWRMRLYICVYGCWKLCD